MSGCVSKGRSYIGFPVSVAILGRHNYVTGTNVCSPRNVSRYRIRSLFFITYCSIKNLHFYLILVKSQISFLIDYYVIILTIDLLPCFFIVN